MYWQPGKRQDSGYEYCSMDQEHERHVDADDSDEVAQVRAVLVLIRSLGFAEFVPDAHRPEEQAHVPASLVNGQSHRRSRLLFKEDPVLPKTFDNIKRG